MRTWPVHRACSRDLAAVSMPKIAELVPSGCFCAQSTCFQEKHPIVYLDRAVIDKQPASCLVTWELNKVCLGFYLTTSIRVFSEIISTRGKNVELRF